MLYVVRYQAGNGGWALSTIINSTLGYDIVDSGLPQRSGNAHWTTLYQKLVSTKNSMRTQTDCNLDNICLPVIWGHNVPKSAAVVIRMFRSSHHEYTPWYLFNKESGWEYTKPFIDNAIAQSQNISGEFDTSLAFDYPNVEYMQEFFDKYSLAPTQQTWDFYQEYVAGNQRLIQQYVQL